MPTYSNGRIPRTALVVFGSGFDKDGRYYEWLLPPRTYRKHVALVAIGRDRSGKTIRPSVGYSCYRPLDEQHYARGIHGIYAATPGASSHGGDWSGPPTGWRKVDAAAIDYSNYIDVFGSEEAFFDACREVGLTPKGIWPPAFPREAWHVIDLDNPYGPLPAGQNVKDFEEDDMPEYHLWSQQGKDALVGDILQRFQMIETPDGNRSLSQVLNDLLYRRGGSFSIVSFPFDDQGIYIVSQSTGARAHIHSPAHVDMLQRLRRGDAVMNFAEAEICRGYLVAVNPPVDVRVDVESLAAELATILPDGGDDVDAAVVQAAVNAAIDANVSKIAVGVNDESDRRERERLGS